MLARNNRSLPRRKLLWSFDRLASLRSACQHGPHDGDHGKCQDPCHKLAAVLWWSRHSFLLAIWPRCFSFGITVGRWTIIRRCHQDGRTKLLRKLRVHLIIHLEVFCSVDCFSLRILMLFPFHSPDHSPDHSPYHSPCRLATISRASCSATANRAKSIG